jgi:hypothetical protein
MGERERKLSLKNLMAELGSAMPGSASRPALEAEYERRKFFWQRIAIVIAGVGVLSAIVFGIIHYRG